MEATWFVAEGQPPFSFIVLGIIKEQPPEEAANQTPRFLESTPRVRRSVYSVSGYLFRKSSHELFRLARP
jgi:hypothetical protein